MFYSVFYLIMTETRSYVTVIEIGGSHFRFVIFFIFPMYLPAVGVVSLRHGENDVVHRQLFRFRVRLIRIRSRHSGLFLGTSFPRPFRYSSISYSWKNIFQKKNQIFYYIYKKILLSFFIRYLSKFVTGTTSGMSRNF